MKRSQSAGFLLETLAGILINGGVLWLLVERTALPFYVSSLVSIAVSIGPRFAAEETRMWRQPRDHSFALHFVQHNISKVLVSILVHLAVLLFFKEWLGLHYLLANLFGFVCGSTTLRLPGLRDALDGVRGLLSTPVKCVFVGSLLMRLLLASGFGAGFDEAYYYSYSLRPSLSYFDHPPFVGFLAGFFPYVTGLATPLTIRLGAVLLFSFASLFFYALARKVLPERGAFFAFTLFNITPMLFLGAGTGILPDSGLVFFWILALWSFWLLLHQDGSRRRWVSAGLLTGLAMLSKYHGVLLILLLFTYLILYRRRSFMSAGPYIYLLAALAVFSPVILWNLQHGFVSFIFQGSRAFGASFSPTRIFGSLGLQAAYLTPMIFLPICYVAYLSFWRGVMRGGREERFYFFFGTVPVIMLNLVAFMRPVLPHWALPGYVVLIIPLGRVLHEQWDRRAAVRQVARVSLTVLLILIALGYLHTRFGILHLEKLSERGWVPEKVFRKDPTLDTHGWERVEDYLLARKVDPERVFLFTHRWFLSAEIELATRGQFTVMCFNEHDSRGFGMWDADLDMRSRNGIFVCTDRDRISPQERFSAYFGHISSPDSILVERGGARCRTIYLYRCSNLLRKFPVPYTRKGAIS